MNKPELREKMRLLRRQMTKAEAAEKSRKIQSRLFRFNKYLNAKTVMLYVSAFNEPATEEIIRDALKRGKTVAVPVSDTQTETITPSRIYDFNDLARGAYGILEPSEIEPVNVSEIDFILVPGLAFDARGNRMGFGKGYYDKTLALTDAEKTALCYEFQLLEEIPADAHDIKMNTIITEENLYAF